MYAYKKHGIYFNGELLMTMGGMTEKDARKLVQKLNDKEKSKEKNTSPTDQSE